MKSLQIDMELASDVNPILIKRISAIRSLNPEQSRWLNLYLARYGRTKIGDITTEKLNRLLSVFFTQTMCRLGISENNMPSLEDQYGLISEVQNLFPSLKVEEVDAAFNLLFKSCLEGVSTNDHYHNFSLGFLSRVFGAYLKYKPILARKVDNILPVYEEDPSTNWDKILADVEFRIMTILPIYQDFVESGSIEFYRYSLHQIYMVLQESEIFILPDDAKIRIYNECLASLRAEMQSKAMDNENITSFLDYAFKPKTHEAEAQIQAKRIACIEAFKHFKRNDIDLKKALSIDFDSCNEVDMEDALRIKQLLQENRCLDETQSELDICLTYLYACINHLQKK